MSWEEVVKIGDRVSKQATIGNSHSLSSPSIDFYLISSLGLIPYVSVYIYLKFFSNGIIDHNLYVRIFSLSIVPKRLRAFENLSYEMIYVLKYSAFRVLTLAQLVYMKISLSFPCKW